jgi:uncharacterized protein
MPLPSNRPSPSNGCHGQSGESRKTPRWRSQVPRVVDGAARQSERTNPLEWPLSPGLARCLPIPPLSVRRLEGRTFRHGSLPAGMNKALFPFLVLVFALSVPFWLLGTTTHLELLPGLPVAALAACNPMIAAAILVYRENGRSGVAKLLRRSLDLRRVPSFLSCLPVFGIMPLVMTTSFLVARLAGPPVPDPRISLLPASLLVGGFFVAAEGEELGWTGYALEPAQERWGPLGAGVVLGTVWALLHYVALAQAHRSPSWIAWWSLNTIALRVIMVWLYRITGRSVFASSLFHMTINVTWQLFPCHGSHYDPRTTGIITACLAVVLAVSSPGFLFRTAAPAGP